MIDQNTYPELEPGTVPADGMSIRPRSNFVNVLVLRELQSHAVFTTNGEDADLATIALDAEAGPQDYAPGLMFMRKQSGSDRRFGKALQRDLSLFDEDEDECTMQVNEMCQDCVECILFGSAASSDEGSDVSITSRVMYDTAYTLRDASVIIDEKFQNAPGDDYAKSAEATIREPDFFEPGTMFPSVVTLRDATPAEVAFVLGITAKNKRYGATTSRLGRIDNRVLGVYVGSEEGSANLELTRETIRRLRDDEGTSHESLTEVVMAEALDPNRTASHVSAVFDDAIERDALDLQRVSDETVDELLEMATSEDLADVLAAQREASRTFLSQAE